MNDGASMQSGAWGQVRVREPAGERVLGETLSIGGTGSEVVVPGVDPGAALSVRRLKGLWLVQPAPGAVVRFNGRPLSGERDLRRDDVLSVGDAQVRVGDASRTLLRLSVEHLAGNVTIAPAAALAAVAPEDGGDEDLEIQVPAALAVAHPGKAAASSASARRAWWLAAAAGAAAALVLLAGRVGSVALDVRPQDARVRTPGALSLQLGRRLLILPGRRVVRAEREGFLPAEAAVLVRPGAASAVHLLLARLPGQLQIDTGGVVAAVSIDGVAAGLAPRGLTLPPGGRTLSLRAPRYVDYAPTLPIQGAGVRSAPAGAEVTIAGTHRGRAPLAVELPAGIAYPVIMSLPGYATWTQEVFATAGRSLSADARLTPVLARVKVAGEPAGAELLIDGAPRGQTPQSLSLPAVEHRIEVRKAGFVSFEGIVTPAPELERTVSYHLTPSDRGQALLESAPLIRSQTGYLLRLVPPGTFQMGSERREPGRRPNEGLRSVTLQRPFYIGVQAVTNGEFRRFRATHASGYIERQSLDLDSQPGTPVSWGEAAEVCNWLSQRDGLPRASARSGNGLVLTRPVARGARLPTEAEWEYAARYGAAGQSQRFVWGDSPPVPPQVGNLAGSETGSSLPATLPGYRDDYPVLAPVRKVRPTALGLHDGSGNVSQGVNDYS